jgi:sugar lactone lactonase YvrE
MNTCLDNTGCLLTSESNGLVKRYSLDGEMQEVVGVADVEAGCKNSSIGLSADGSSLYYLDIHNGTVVVLEKAG